MDPTPYSDINALLGELLSSVRGALDDQFIGLYLYGSLSGGDFDPDRSDIDFVVATRAEVSEAAFGQLADMHARLAAGESNWARKLEGAYVPEESLGRHRRDDAPHPFFNEGTFCRERLASDWIIQRFIVRERGIVIAGPDPKSLIDPVEPEDLKNAVRCILREWWLPHLGDPWRLKNRDYQAYAVLTMCRALYTLEYGTVASKPVSARWARAVVDRHWTGLIDRAAAWRPDDGVDDVQATLGFIRQTLQCAIGLHVES